MKKPSECISTMVNGIIHNDIYIFDMEETVLYGQSVYIAETIDGKKGYVSKPNNYVHTKFLCNDDFFKQPDNRESFINLDYVIELTRGKR